MRRIAFFFAIRRCSLLEMNQRLLRMVLRIPLLTIFLRNRLSNESWDSPLRKFTEANEITFFHYKIDKIGYYRTVQVDAKPGVMHNYA
ncbi:MAG: hypothetical protein A2Z03_06960 [Chloroflexi bacterium RBG_16_56_8]|nr:MAG: hypothetical protein A2Z03_06960 [Chloroflexi bacterium RBG_16_56_8]